MVQMPPGVPTATMGIDAGENAALFIARILSNYNENIKDNLEEYMKSLKKDYYE
jgi:5-(carboxyamino)imidazole ribonucleotide mutase